MSTLQTTLSTLDISDASFLSDPYPQFASLRHERMAWHTSMRAWMAVDYGTVALVLRDSRFGPSPPPGNPLTLQFVSGDEHARLKRPVADMFGRSAARGMEATIGDELRVLLDGLPPGQVVDAMNDILLPLTGRSTARMLGLDIHTLPALLEATVNVAAGMGPAPDASEANHAGEAAALVRRYFAQIVAERIERPGDDLISMLVRSDALSQVDCQAMAMLLFFTGTIPLALALGNALVAMLAHQDQIDSVRRRPELLLPAVEECLRYDPVIQLDARKVRTDMVLHGQQLRAGDDVLVFVGAANRDESVFADAERFDVSRQPNPHLSFGRGEHTCLGLHVAQVAMKVVLSGLLLQEIDVQIAGNPERLRMPVMRGLRTLPLLVARADRRLRGSSGRP
jgi:cytochrome P450